MTTWDDEVDLLVFGSGAAGMSAALTGAHAGLKAMLCEKTDLLGGTSATSGGSLWVPGAGPIVAPCDQRFRRANCQQRQLGR